MIYRCTCCHLIFDEPDVMRRRENLDGERGYVLVAEKFCPDCGAEEAYFETYRGEEDEDSENLDARHEPRGVA